MKCKTLSELRDEADLDQEDLSKKSGIARVQISRLENGRHRPTRDTVRKLAKGLGCSVATVKSAVRATLASCDRVAR